jgi:hypothetical protein
MEDYDKLDLKEKWYEEVDWIHLDVDRKKFRASVKTLMKLWFPYETGNFLIR